MTELHVIAAISAAATLWAIYRTRLGCLLGQHDPMEASDMDGECLAIITRCSRRAKELGRELLSRAWSNGPGALYVRPDQPT